MPSNTREAFKYLIFYGIILGVSILPLANRFFLGHRNYQVDCFLLILICFGGIIVGGIGVLISLWTILDKKKVGE